MLAHRTYYGTGFQNLAGYVYAGMRVVGLGTTEPMDFDAALTHATLLTAALKEGQDPLSNERGDVRHLKRRWRRARFSRPSCSRIEPITARDFRIWPVTCMRAGAHT